MHWLHLPAGRIPAFLNKALTPPPSSSSSSSSSSSAAAADLTALHHHYFSAVWTPNTNSAGEQQPIWCGNNITQNSSTWRTTYRGSDGTARGLNSAARDHRKQAGDRDGWSHVVEIPSSRRSEVISSRKKLDMKRECFPNQTPLHFNTAEMSIFSYEDRMCCVAIHN